MPKQTRLGSRLLDNTFNAQQMERKLVVELSLCAIPFNVTARPFMVAARVITSLAAG